MTICGGILANKRQLCVRQRARVRACVCLRLWMSKMKTDAGSFVEKDSVLSGRSCSGHHQRFVKKRRFSLWDHPECVCGSPAGAEGEAPGADSGVFARHQRAQQPDLPRSAQSDQIWSCQRASRPSAKLLLTASQSLRLWEQTRLISLCSVFFLCCPVFPMTDC